jgi:hypothetical protein
VAVLVSVVLACLFGMMRGVNMMALRHVRMVTGFVVVTGIVMLGGYFVLGSGMLVVFGSFAVMFRGLFRHGLPPGGMISTLDFSGMTAGLTMIFGVANYLPALRWQQDSRYPAVVRRSKHEDIVGPSLIVLFRCDWPGSWGAAHPGSSFLCRRV